eukprot:5917319-Prymnesium_polylepis.1
MGVYEAEESEVVYDYAASAAASPSPAPSETSAKRVTLTVSAKVGRIVTREKTKAPAPELGAPMRVPISAKATVLAPRALARQGAGSARGL